MSSTSMIWFRRDLRLADNPCVADAVRTSEFVVPVYILEAHDRQPWSSGAASRWWLHMSLDNLSRSLGRLGSRLIIRRGEPLQVLLSLIEETGANSLFFNRLYEAASRERDEGIEKVLRSRGLLVKTHNSSLLHEPNMVRTNDGKAFRVFTPFWNRLTQMIDLGPLQSAPPAIAFPKNPIMSLSVDELALKPRIDWCQGMRDTWTPGESGAHKKLKEFIDSRISRYDSDRDRPDQSGVSMLSPHLHFGEIGPQQIWHAIRSKKDQDIGTQTYLKELGWREFAHHVLFNFPHTSDTPLRPEFENFPWCMDKVKLKAWQRGRTGFPIVDAGMRQLWHTGWMHNRVRMIVASFLTKDLLIPWIEGARWFWDTLVDADLASNSMGWQWAAGCGADAAPYFRIFNPVLQGKKFDPAGDYVRRWVPELAALSTNWIHEPWQAPPLELRAAGVSLGMTYPSPIVDHAWARQRALEAFSNIKAGDEVNGRHGKKSSSTRTWTMERRK